MTKVTANRLSRIMGEISQIVDRCGYASAYWLTSWDLIPPGRMKLDDFRVFLAAAPEQFQIERFEDESRRVFFWITRAGPGSPAVPGWAKYRLGPLNEPSYLTQAS